MSRRQRGERTPLNAEINVVSLIDVMMLLLVIFMITAPLMQGGIQVRLPKGEARPLESPGDIIVTVARNGRVSVDERTMTFDQFRAAFPAIAERRGRRGVVLRGDEAVDYGQVVRVLGVMMRAGATDVGIAVEPTPR